MTAGLPPIMPQVCYLPDCSTVPSWAVTDLDGAGQLGACELHVARLVDRKLRRMGSAEVGPRVIVSPLFTVEDVADLAPLLAIGAEVYGLVATRRDAGLVADLDGEHLDALLRSYGGKEARR